MLAILAPIIVFGIVIFVHELGHFIAAKLTGVYAPRFSIGFGPALLRHRRGETEYVLAALPLGTRLLLIAAIPAFVEELCFRGLALGGLKSRGPWFAVGATSVVFAAFHVVQPQGLFLDRFAPTLLLGLLLGTVRWRTGSVWPGMLLHFLHNGLMAWAIGQPEWLTAKGLISTADDQLRVAPTLLAGCAALLAGGLLLAWLPRQPRIHPTA